MMLTTTAAMEAVCGRKRKLFSLFYKKIYLYGAVHIEKKNERDEWDLSWWVVEVEEKDESLKFLMTNITAVNAVVCNINNNNNNKSR